MGLLHMIFPVMCLGAHGLILSKTASNVAVSKEPRVAVLLVGLPRGWTREYVNDVLNGVVNLHRADMFIHMCDSDRHAFDGLVEALGSPVQKAQGECVVRYNRSAEQGPLEQFWHLRKAFNLMEDYEKSKGFNYDVVIKMRTEISPAADKGSSLDLAGWEEAGRLHMMTDMLFWGQRQDMAVMADFYTASEVMYADQYSNPFDRPIDLKALYETYLRDVRNAPNVTKKAPWYAYNKLEALPYPNNGIEGAIESLRVALNNGIKECPSPSCSLRCGERYATLCENGGKDYCGKWGCKAHPDYTPGRAVAEKDILTWPLSKGIIVCDIGSSFTHYRGKIGVQGRKSRDCD